MFESITFFNQNTTDTSKPLDIGALVECMLFYGKTSIVANHSILRQLFMYFGIDRVTDIVKRCFGFFNKSETGVTPIQHRDKFVKVL